MEEYSFKSARPYYGDEVNNYRNIRRVLLRQIKTVESLHTNIRVTVKQKDKQNFP